MSDMYWCAFRFGEGFGVMLLLFAVGVVLVFSVVFGGMWLEVLGRAVFVVL